jgi:hypothetical protein
METGKSVRNGCNTIPEILRLTILFGWCVQRLEAIYAGNAGA